MISLCTNGSCPTVYLIDRDTVLVQGNAATGVTVADGELVEIPRELLLEAARRIREQDA